MFYKFTIVIIILVCLVFNAEARLVLRQKRDGGFDQIAQALAKLTAPLLGNKERPQNNDPVPLHPHSEGSVNRAAPAGPGLLETVGVCDGNLRCEYLTCLAQNFKNSDKADSLKQGSQVMADPDLREAITNDPKVSQIACEKANLDKTGCNGFLQLLGLVNKIDPKSRHIHDEPREKRSPDYYDEVGKSKKTAGSKTGSGGAQGSSGSGSGGSSSNKGSGGTPAPQPANSRRQRNCDEVLRGGSGTGEAKQTRRGQPLKQRRIVGGRRR